MLGGGFHRSRAHAATSLRRPARAPCLPRCPVLGLRCRRLPPPGGSGGVHHRGRLRDSPRPVGARRSRADRRGPHASAITRSARAVPLARRSSALAPPELRGRRRFYSVMVNRASKSFSPSACCRRRGLAGRVGRCRSSVGRGIPRKSPSGAPARSGKCPARRERPTPGPG